MEICRCAVGRGRGSREPSPLASHWSPLCSPTLCNAGRAQSWLAPSTPTLLPLCRAKCGSAEHDLPAISPLPNSPPPTLLLHYSSLLTLQSRAVQSTICRIKPGSQGPQSPRPNSARRQHKICYTNCKKRRLR